MVDRWRRGDRRVESGSVQRVTLLQGYLDIGVE